MGLGGNPYGPAGTGKTESVKALGGLFGRQVLVFNCDEVRMQMHAIIATVCGLQIERSGFEPWPGHCVVFLGKTLYSHSASLHPGV